MTTILAHVRVKPGKAAQFEQIEREMTIATHAGEPDCLRYECWRGEEPNSYKVILAFRNAAAFYEHQISDWHEGHLSGLIDCFDDVRLEFLDPVCGMSADFQPTTAEPLPADAPKRALEYQVEFPVLEPAWWRTPQG